MMGPDGFGFDSLVNYLGYPLHTDEFPWCEAAHLITARGEIEGDAYSLSLDYLRSCFGSPANARLSRCVHDG